MKVKDIKSFRDINLKVVELTNVSKHIIEGLELQKYSEPLIGIFYVDHECGLSLRFIGDKDNIITDSNLMARADSFEDLEFKIIDDKNYKEILKQQEIYYPGPLKNVRDDDKIDKFRHPEFPDDVLAILINEGNENEQMWVRTFAKMDQDNLYVAELLDDSYYDKDYKAGKNVLLVLHEQDGETFLIINGFVKIQED